MIWRSWHKPSPQAGRQRTGGRTARQGHQAGDDQARREAEQQARREAGAAYQSGNRYHNSGDCDRAIADLTRAIQLDPENRFYYQQPSLSYRARGGRTRADADLKRGG